MCLYLRVCMEYKKQAPYYYLASLIKVNIKLHKSKEIRKDKTQIDDDKHKLFQLAKIHISNLVTNQKSCLKLHINVIKYPRNYHILSVTYSPDLYLILSFLQVFWRPVTIS